METSGSIVRGSASNCSALPKGNGIGAGFHGALRSLTIPQGKSMIVTRTPFRITLGGGGTDLPSFYREHGGFVLAVAIDKYMYLNVNTPILDDYIRIRYTKNESVRAVEQVEHTLAKAALEHFGIKSG